jgi:hypothetical protein
LWYIFSFIGVTGNEGLGKDAIDKFNDLYHRDCIRQLIDTCCGYSLSCYFDCSQTAITRPLMVEPFEFVIFNSAINFCDLS